MALERLLIRPIADVRELEPLTDIAELSAIDYALAIDIGTVSATAINIGRVGFLTTILGDLQVDGTTTLISTSTLEGDVNIGDGGNTITIGGDGVAGAGDVIYLGTESTGIGSDSDVTLRTLMLVDGSVYDGRITGDDATFNFSDAGCGVILPNVGSGAAVALDGSIIIDGSDLKWYDGAAWITAAVLGGVTLDFAYDGGGLGAGRIITCDQGAVEITGSNAADYALEVTNSAAGGVLYINNTGTGLTLNIQDGGANVFNIADDKAFDINSAAFDLNATGNITINSDAVIDIDAVGTIDIDSSTGTIGIGTINIDQNINIGTGGKRSIQIGNNNANTRVDIDAGVGGAVDIDANSANIELSTLTTGNIRLVSAGDIGITADDDSSWGVIVAAKSLNIGVSGGGVQVLGLSSEGTGADAVDINATAGGIEVDAVGAIAINSSGSTIGIGNDADAFAINIGTGAAARVITVGDAASVEVEVNALLVDINAGNSLTMNAGAASNFTVDSADLTFQTTTSNDVIIDGFRDVLIKNNTNLVATFDANGLTLAAGASINEFSIDGTLGDNSDIAVPTEKAVKTYVDTVIAGADLWVATADEAIVIGDAICGARATDGRVNQANADALGVGRQYCLGFAVTAAVGAGNTFNVQSSGLAAQVTCPAAEAWTRGDAIYLDDVAAHVSNVAPVGVGDVVQIVGWAAETNAMGTARTMFIALGDPTVV